MSEESKSNHKTKADYRPRNFRSKKNYNLIDLNCDLGQSLGPLKYTESEEKLLPFVTSVNIACGAHAGNEGSILEALKKAKSLNLTAGAHLGYEDLANFGREDPRIGKKELKSLIFKQLNLIHALATQVQIEIIHCRPHGAMYSKALEEEDFAIELAQCISSFSRWLILVLPLGVNVEKISERSGLKVVTEGLLDRSYKRSGGAHKFPPNKPLSFEFVRAQIDSIVFNGQVIAEGGKRLRASYLSTINLKPVQEGSLIIAERVYKLLKENQRLFSLDSLLKIENFQLSDLLEN